MDKLGVHGTCDILLAEIRKNAGQSSVDVKALITGMTIRESLYNNNLTASLTLIDTVGLLEDYPLIGEELFAVSLQDPMLDVKIDLEFFIYSIRNITIMPNNNGVRYTIDLLTRSSFQAKMRKVIASFNKPASGIVKDIFDQTYEKLDLDGENSTDVKKGVVRLSDGKGASNYELFNLADGRVLTVEDTESIVRCVIPNYTPDLAMNFLAVRSVSHDSSPSCSFKFFETKSGYFFVTDEYLIRQAVNGSVGNRVKKLNYNPMPDIDPKNILLQEKKIKKLDIVKYINTIDDLNSGAYNSKIIEIDVLYGVVTDIPFDASMAKKLFTGMNGTKSESSGERHTDDFINTYFNKENERVHVFVKDYDTYSDVQLKGNQYIPEISLNRMAYDYRLNATSVRATIDGRLDLSVGDVISLAVPEFTANDKKNISDKFSGNYLISEVSHVISGKALETEFVMSKYGWENI